MPPNPADGGEIGAMAVHADSLYVVRQLPANVTRFVVVYDVATMSVVRRIFVPDLGHSSFGLAIVAASTSSSAVDRRPRLFVSDFHQSLVHRVGLDPEDGEAATTSWRVASHPVGLSATGSGGHLLVTCSWANAFQLYDADDGRLVRETPFSVRDRRDPEYAVELTTPDGSVLYAVSHKGAVSGVCLVNAVDGSPVACFGRRSTPMRASRSSSALYMSEPRGLVVLTRSRCLLVADKCNHRIVVVDATLRRARVLPLQVEGDDAEQGNAGEDGGAGGLVEPQSICLDEARNRLYVGEFDGKSRIVVVDNVNDIEINE